MTRLLALALLLSAATPAIAQKGMPPVKRKLERSETFVGEGGMAKPFKLVTPPWTSGAGPENWIFVWHDGDGPIEIHLTDQKQRVLAVLYKGEGIVRGEKVPIPRIPNGKYKIIVDAKEKVKWKIVFFQRTFI